MKKNAIKVLDYLKTKPKVKDLGFNKEELEGVAADIADNLALSEEATDEEVDKAVQTAVDAMIPYLVIAQKTANRVIERKRNEPSEPKEPKEPKKVNEPVKEPKVEKTEDTLPEWAKGLIESNNQLKDLISGFKAEQGKSARRKELSKKLEGTGTFGKTVLKNFDKMVIDSDEAFDEFLSDVDSDLSALNQERANEGLSKLGTAASSQRNKVPEVEPLSDAEIQTLADNL